VEHGCPFHWRPFALGAGPCLHLPSLGAGLPGVFVIVDFAKSPPFAAHVAGPLERFTYAVGAPRTGDARAVIDQSGEDSMPFQGGRCFQVIAIECQVKIEFSFPRPGDAGFQPPLCTGRSQTGLHPNITSLVIASEDEQVIAPGRDRTAPAC
jgi:hypothetical protein